MDNKKVQISVSQFAILYFVIIIVDSKIQGIMINDLEQNFIISSIIGMALSIGIYTLYYLLSRRTNFAAPDKAFSKITGKFIAKIILFLYGIYFLYLSMQDLREISEMVREYYIPNAPLKFISVPLMLVVFYALTQGLEVICRASRYIFTTSVVTLSLFLLLILLLNEVQLNHLIPLFNIDLKKIIFKGAQMSYSIPFGITFILFFIAPAVKEKDKLLRKGYVANISGGLALIAIIVVALITINPTVLPASISPLLLVTRRIDAPNFIQRFDVLTIALFVLTTLTKNSILLYGAYTCVNGVVKVKNRTVLYLIFAVIILTMTNSLFSRFTYFLLFIEKYVVTYVHLFYELFLPVVLLLLTFIVKIEQVPMEELTNN